MSDSVFVSDSVVVARRIPLEPAATVLVAGLAIALYLQGAFFLTGQLVVAAVLVAGALLAPGGFAVNKADVPLLAAGAGLAAWALLDGALSGRIVAGAGYALLIAGVLTLAGVCRALPGAARAQLVDGLAITGCLVAAAGWLGVVGHSATWGFQSPGLWRASATLTYPNATACVLAMLALVCLARYAREPGARWRGVAAAALLTGLVATLSRAGVAGFLIGLLVLVVILGWRPVFRAVGAPLLGASIAVAALLPAITAATPSAMTTGIAVAGALAGLVLGGIPALGRLVPLVPVMAVAVALPAHRALRERFTLDSPDRWSAVRAAWQVFLDHVSAGSGPGLPRLTMTRAQGGTDVFRFAHNEYVQVLAELGVIGGLLLLAMLAALAVALFRRPPRASRAAGLAVLAALLVHAGFDFVWHIPAIPLLAAALIGMELAENPTSIEEAEGT